MGTSLAKLGTSSRHKGYLGHFSAQAQKIKQMHSKIFIFSPKKIFSYVLGNRTFQLYD